MIPAEAVSALAGDAERASRLSAPASPAVTGLLSLSRTERYLLAVGLNAAVVIAGLAERLPDRRHRRGR
jgi:hypothetical protein